MHINPLDNHDFNTSPGTVSSIYLNRAHVHTLPFSLHKNPSTKLREHGLPPRSQYLPTAYTNDLPTPAIVKEEDASDYSEIWRDFRVCEFGGFLQANTFKPAWQPNDYVIDAK